MSQTVITQAFEALKAQEAANHGVVTLDEFVFASVPNLNITDPISRTEGLPPAAQIVHRQAVSKTGMVNSNAVVYSVVLGADVGDFEFNWVGLLNKASGVVAMIVHAPSQKKIKTASGQQGNVLTRSFLMEYNGASTQTNITTPADTWQIDFTARLNGVDERIRLENIDTYGAASFLKDGFLVSAANGSYQVKKGAAYIEGLRAELLFDQAVVVASLPSKIWVDVCWRGTLTSVWAAATKITVADTLANYVTGDEQHYVYAIAEVLDDGTVVDLRQASASAQLMGLSAEANVIPYFDKNAKLKKSALSEFIRQFLAIPDAEGALERLGLTKPDGAKHIVIARGRTQSDKNAETVSIDDFKTPDNDDDAAISAAIAHVVSTGGELVGTRAYQCSAGIVLPTGRYSLNLTGSKFIFAAGVSVAVTVGTAGADPYRGAIRGLQIEKASFAGSDIGVLLLNCVEAALESPVVTNFSKAIACIPGASSRVAYSTIFNPTLTNHEYGFYAKPPASSYVNENTVIGGRFASNVNGRLIDQIYLDNATGQGVQHNRFNGVSIEGYNGAGACGRTAINVVNDANQNIFSFCRTEKYGAGWSSGFSAVFGANTSGNFLEDTRIDVTISDVSGLNQWDTRLGGIKRVGHDTSVSAAPMLKLIRQQPLNNPATKFAIDVEDTYSASGDVGLIRYQSRRGSGNVVEITTFYGTVLKITGEGEFLTAIKTASIETTSADPNYFNGRIGTVGTKNLTPATGATGLLVYSNTSSNTGGVGAEFITNNVAGRQHISFSNPNGVVGSISTSANATSFNTSSDEHLKFGVKDADPSGDIIDAIQVRQFDWKADGSHQDYGFIAQELHKVFPYAVTDGGDDEDAMWSVDYSKLVPLLVKEMQQLRKHMKALEGK
ncbi:phage tail protein [Kluyvera ascorbata]|nr:phage tail protein [Kluyvera ascorbata]